MSGLFAVGDEVDVLDSSDIYCPGKVLGITSLADNVISYRIGYRGWSESWDEDILSSANRIQPSGSFVTKCKCWVKFSLKMCFWPCVVFIRRPKPLNDSAIQFLKEEKKVYVEPFGEFAYPIRPYKHGVWMCTNKIRPYLRPIDSLADQELQKPYKSNFSIACEEARNSTISDANFKFIGTLEVELEKSKSSSQATGSKRGSSKLNLHSSHQQNLKKSKVSVKPNVPSYVKSAVLCTLSKLIGDCYEDDENDAESIIGLINRQWKSCCEELVPVTVYSVFPNPYGTGSSTGEQRGDLCMNPNIDVNGTLNGSTHRRRGRPVGRNDHNNSSSKSPELCSLDSMSSLIPSVSSSNSSGFNSSSNMALNPFSVPASGMKIQCSSIETTFDSNISIGIRNSDGFRAQKREPMISSVATVSNTSTATFRRERKPRFSRQIEIKRIDHKKCMEIIRRPRF